MKAVKLLLAGIVGTGLLSCVVPNLLPANASPGHDFVCYGGASAYKYHQPGVFAGSDCEGISPNIGLFYRYTFPKGENTSLFAQAGLTSMIYESYSLPNLPVIGWAPDSTYSQDHIPYASLGIQYEVKNSGTSFQASVESPSTLSLAVYSDITNRKTERAIITWGIKTSLLIIPSSITITFHPTSRLHVYLIGTPIIPTDRPPGWAMQAGLGYSLVK